MDYAADENEYASVGSERDESSAYSTSEQLKIANKLRVRFNLLILCLCVTTIGLIGIYTLAAYNGFAIDPITVFSNAENLPEDVFATLLPHLEVFNTVIGVENLGYIAVIGLFLLIIACFILGGRALSEYVKIDKTLRYGRLHADLINTSTATFVIFILYVYLLTAILTSAL